MNQSFIELMEMLEQKYFCPDLQFQYYDLDEEQIDKRLFDEEDLKIQYNQEQNLEKGIFYLPAFYEEPVNLPISGTKFMRSRVEYYCGDLAQVVVEIGYWRLKPHDLQHRDYVVTGRNKIGIAYWKDERKWALLNPKDWNKRKEELDEDISNPLIRQIELEFFDKLIDARKARETYVTYEQRKHAKYLFDCLNDIKWYLKNIPMLWSVFKLYPKDMFKHIMDRVDAVYSQILNNAISYVEELDEEKVLVKRESEMNDLDIALRPLLRDGFEVVDNQVYPNFLRMYFEKQQTDYFANLETLQEYKKIACNLAGKHLKNDNKEEDEFVTLENVEKQYFQKL
ncbi:hypothetical protein [Niallia sp.]|uniref:hypothetical protein n=1 Tax=Niallia sp. TaxID=2837523 RepID=UPI0028A16989|nr:hypothetical protein [Niallia sp.]